MAGRTYNQADYRFGFNGKENDNDINGTGNALDFGARIYDNRLGRWLSVDPLQKKYSAFSPYNFAANSPILLLDREGRDIIINDPVTGSSHIYIPNGPIPDGASSFVIDTYNSLNFEYNSGANSSTQIINDLVDKANNFNVEIYEENRFGGGRTRYNPDTRIIYYNPYEGLIVSNGRQSPALGLLHELDHSNRHRQLIKEFKKTNSEDSKKALEYYYKTLSTNTKDGEENRVVHGSEKDAADATGEGSRIDYSDLLGIFKAKSPTSTEEGTPTKKEKKKIDSINKKINNEIKRKNK